MASYTDNKLQNFVPYTEQQPLQQMLGVGLQKQQQYDQGVQKIQTSIDNVAGLDIMRDVDKGYLQSKLDALGNNLKGVAAADFSNSQLTNSVAGMAGQIGKDEFVQAAVYSTANDRKQTSQMDIDKKEGKLTPHSEYNYQLKRSAYLNNPNLKDDNGKPIAFSGKYTPSWDVDGNILKAVNAVGDSKWTADNVFKLDPSTGLPLRDIVSVKDPKTGKIVQVDKGPVYSDVAIKEMRAGKFNENITAAINSVLDRPEAKQEMAMRGVYNYRGYDDIGDFVSQYKEQASEGVALLEDKKLELMSKLTTETNPDEKKQYELLLNQINSNITGLKTESDAMISQANIYSNVDDYKAALYTQKEKNNWIKAYTTEQYSKEYIKNIPYEVGREKIKAERDWWAAQQGINQGWARIELSKEELKQKKTEWDYNPNNPNASTNTKNEVPLEKANDASTLYGEFLDKGTELNNSFNAAQKKFVLDWMTTITHESGSKLSDKDILKSFNNYVATIPGFLERKYEEAKRDVANNHDNVAFSNLATSLPILGQFEKDMEVHGKRIEDINNDERVKQAGGGDIDFSKMEKGLPSYEIKYNDRTGFMGLSGNEHTVKVTPKDIMNAVVIMNTFKTIKTDSEKSILNNAIKGIETKFGMKFKDALPLMGFKATGSSEGLGNILAVVENMGVDMPSFLASNDYRVNPQVLKQYGLSEGAIKNIYNLSGLMASEKFGNTLKAKEEVLKEKMKGNSPVAYTLYPKDAKAAEIESINTNLNGVINTYKEAGIDVSDFSKFLNGKDKNYDVMIGVDRGTPTSPDQKLTLDLYNGKKLVKSQPITKVQADKIKGYNLKLPEYVSRLQESIQWSESKNTSNSKTAYPNDSEAYKTAFYKPYEISGIKDRTDVMGADVVINNMGVPNVYFYIKNANGDIKGIPFRLANQLSPFAFPSVDAAGAVITNLQSGNIDEIITNSTPKTTK